MKIGILGIGGVGGYFGGKLAQHYRQSNKVDIIFIARPQTAAAIKEEGLKIISPDGQQTIRPKLVATSTDEIGELDVLICATKSYDLEAAIVPLRSCITSRTLILPLLNGVDAKDIIHNVYPDAEVLDGCVYVNAKKQSSAVIQKNGLVEKLFFGSQNLPISRLEELQQVLREAGVDSVLSPNIESDVWTKFVFTAGMATSTSYFDETIGAVLQHPEHRATLLALIREAHAVATANGIDLPGDIEARAVQTMELLPFDATSSMHRDFQQGGRTEYRSLTRCVADLGDSLGVETPTFDVIVSEFDRRS